MGTAPTILINQITKINLPRSNGPGQRDETKHRTFQGILLTFRDSFIIVQNFSGDYVKGLLFLYNTYKQPCFVCLLFQTKEEKSDEANN